jgi:hypothetical protein
MKKHTTLNVLIFLIISAFNASAIQLSDFIGSWSGKRKETQNGVGLYSNIQIEGKYRPDGGVVLIEKGNWPTFGAYTSKHNFWANGKYSSTATTSYGLIIASTSGHWRKSSSHISTSGKNSNTSGTNKFKGTLKLVSKNKMIYSGNSGGSKLVITGTRR